MFKRKQDKVTLPGLSRETVTWLESYGYGVWIDPEGFAHVYPLTHQDHLPSPGWIRITAGMVQ